MTTPVANSGNSFINENHIHLLDHLSQFARIIENNWDQGEFAILLANFIIDIDNHFSHEELILRGVGYTDLEDHATKHRELGLRMDLIDSSNVSHENVDSIISDIRSMILEHELFEDQQYWPVFEGHILDKHSLIPWSPNFETGDPDVNKEHQALLVHINHFFAKLKQEKDITRACEELKLLAAFSRYHFEQEEKHLGENLRTGHAANHQKLLADLDNLIDEISEGKFNLNNPDSLSDYLTFWLLNHIKTHDVPAFARE